MRVDAEEFLPVIAEHGIACCRQFKPLVAESHALSIYEGKVDVEVARNELPLEFCHEVEVCLQLLVVSSHSHVDLMSLHGDIGCDVAQIYLAKTSA